MKQYGTAVVAGKFWPFHKGHAYLLRKAMAAANHVEILLVARSWEVPAAEQRALAIHDFLSIHGQSYSLHIVGDLNTDDSSERSNELWARYTEAILGYIPSVVVSSESYGSGWAKAMGVDHICIDPDRLAYSVSGTKVRNNYASASDMLPEATKAQLLPRVVVLGAESTGTTTLATDLADHYKTQMVPELGRLIAESALVAGKPIGVDEWDMKLFEVIVHGQDAMEERLARNANRVLICDTDSWASAVWWKRYHKDDIVGYAHFKDIGKKQALRHKLNRPGTQRMYIVTSEQGVPWENDGTRDGQLERSWMEGEFLKNQFEIRSEGIPFIYVTGDREERFTRAAQEIDNLLAGERIGEPLAV